MHALALSGRSDLLSHRVDGVAVKYWNLNRRKENGVKS